MEREDRRMEAREASKRTKGVPGEPGGEPGGRGADGSSVCVGESNWAVILVRQSPRPKLSYNCHPDSEIFEVFTY